MNQYYVKNILDKKKVRCNIMKEYLTYSTKLSKILEFAVERAIDNYEVLLRAKTSVIDINSTVCFEIINYMDEIQDDVIEVLNYLWDLKTANEYEISEDDKILIEKFINIIKENRSNPCEQIRNHMSKTLTANGLALLKVKAIILSLKETYVFKYTLNDEILVNVLENEYCVEKGITGTLTVDEAFVDDFGKYMVNKMINSFDFIKNYLKTWNSNEFDSITKVANNVLNKYRDDEEKFNELKELISERSSSYVYDKNFKQFIFLDHSLAQHTDSILKFVAKSMGYDDWNQIPVELYPQCDEYIKKNIEIKGQNNSTAYLDIFK